jgi:hypothetical protein
MMLRKKGYIDHLITGLLFVVFFFCNFRGGVNINKRFFSKRNKQIKNLKLIYCQHNIEGFKQVSNFIILL